MPSAECKSSIGLTAFPQRTSSSSSITRGYLATQATVIKHLLASIGSYQRRTNTGWGKGWGLAGRCTETTHERGFEAANTPK